jgi:hypothetical protein
MRLAIHITKNLNEDTPIRLKIHDDDGRLVEHMGLTVDDARALCDRLAIGIEFIEEWMSNQTSPDLN